MTNAQSKIVLSIDSELKDLNLDKKVLDNVVLKAAIIRAFKSPVNFKSKMTEEDFELSCIYQDVCVGIVSDIKVSPYYFNKEGSKLCYWFLDIKKNTFRILEKYGHTIHPNIKKYQLKWGDGKRLI